LGGNAKTHTWPNGVTTGLSVLAWPPAYFHNYGALLARLGISKEEVRLPFFVNNPTVGHVAHGRDSPLREAYAQDYARWARLVRTVRRTGRALSSRGANAAPSLYDLSFANPFNLLPLRWACTLFGVSRAFWRDVVVPIYSSSFLTTQLNSVPAVIAPALDDLIPLHGTPCMHSWTHNSAQVFAAMARELYDVRLNFEPEAVLDQAAEGGAPHTGTDADSASRRFLILDGRGGAPVAADAVVFACPSDAARRLLPRRGFALARTLLGLVGYVDDDNTAFLRGKIHSDASVIPAAFRREVLARYANYVEIGPPAPGTGGLPRYENTFVLSSWYPAARRAEPRAAERLPMLVTYDLAPDKPLEGVLGEVDNVRAHPHLSVLNLALAFALRLVQGGAGGRVFFCGSYTTPGNGHDLSLLSGLVAAHALGAPYPFADSAAARGDFVALRGIMGM
jgi:hypothetical protein